MEHASNKKILVVNDEPDVRNFLAACMRDVGYQVETAVDGVDALEKAEANSPDLMTLDMVMPRKSGIQVIRRLRKDERFKRLPVIVITAHAHDEFGSDAYPLEAAPEAKRTKIERIKNERFSTLSFQIALKAR
jgi:CheY-like chemotaxis protein